MPNSLPTLTPDEAAANEFLSQNIVSPAEALQNRVTAQRQMGASLAKQPTPQSWGEYATGKLPFIGGVKTAATQITAIDAMHRINDGTATQEDYDFIVQFLQRQENESKKGFLQRTGDIIAGLPGFMVEFGMTGGAYSGLKAAAKKGLEKGAEKLTERAIGKKLVESGVGQLLKKGAEETLPRAAGVAAQTALMPQMVAGDIASQVLPPMQLSREDGKILDVIISKDDEKSLEEAIPKGVLSSMIELGTERLGEHTRITERLGKLPFLKGAKRAAGEQLDKVAFLKGMKGAIARRWLSKTGRTAKMLRETLHRGGWHTVLDEMGEERAAEVLRGAAGINPNYGATGGIFGGEMGMGPAWKQLAEEALAFQAPGLATGVAGTVATQAERKAIYKRVRTARQFRDELLRRSLEAKQKEAENAQQNEEAGPVHEDVRPRLGEGVGEGPRGPVPVKEGGPGVREGRPATPEGGPQEGAVQEPVDWKDAKPGDVLGDGSVLHTRGIRKRPEADEAAKHLPGGRVLLDGPGAWAVTFQPEGTEEKPEPQQPAETPPAGGPPFELPPKPIAKKPQETPPEEAPKPEEVPPKREESPPPELPPKPSAPTDVNQAQAEIRRTNAVSYGGFLYRLVRKKGKGRPLYHVERSAAGDPSGRVVLKNNLTRAQAAGLAGKWMRGEIGPAKPEEPPKPEAEVGAEPPPEAPVTQGEPGPLEPEEQKRPTEGPKAPEQEDPLAKAKVDLEKTGKATYRGRAYELTEDRSRGAGKYVIKLKDGRGIVVVKSPDPRGSGWDRGQALARLNKELDFDSNLPPPASKPAPPPAEPKKPNEAPEQEDPLAKAKDDLREGGRAQYRGYRYDLWDDPHRRAGMFTIRGTDDAGRRFTLAPKTGQSGWSREQAVQNGIRHMEARPAYPVQQRAHEHSTTQANLPAGIAHEVHGASSKIREQDLTPEGRESQPHITVRYGLQTEDPEKVRPIIESAKPIRATFGKTIVFPATEATKHDVVAVEIKSPGLEELNARIGEAVPSVQDHPEYKPHVTLAYVKPGEGQKYAGNNELEGQEIQVEDVTFSNKNGEPTTIGLKGAPEARRLGGKKRPSLDDISEEDLAGEIESVLKEQPEAKQPGGEKTAFVGPRKQGALPGMEKEVEHLERKKAYVSDMASKLKKALEPEASTPYLNDKTVERWVSDHKPFLAKFFDRAGEDLPVDQLFDSVLNVRSRPDEEDYVHPTEHWGKRYTRAREAVRKLVSDKTEDVLWDAAQEALRQNAPRYRKAQEARKKRLGEKKKKTIKQLAGEANQEVRAALDEFGEILRDRELLSNPFADPRLLSAAGKLTAKLVKPKAGVLNFADAVNTIATRFGEGLTRRLGPVLERSWTVVRDKYSPAGMSPAGRVEDILKEKADTQGPKEHENEPEGRGGTLGGERPDLEGNGKGDLGEKPPEGGGRSEAEGGTGTTASGHGGGVGGHGESSGETGHAPSGGGQPGETGTGGSTGPSDEGGVGGTENGTGVQGNGPGEVHEGAGGNFTLGDEQVGGGQSFQKKARYRQNIAAIRILKRLETEGRLATRAEQAELIKYVGWGGLKELFKHPPDEKWAQEAAELSGLLTEEEYRSAAASINNAHFTDPAIVRAIWAGVQAAGFQGGSIVEPSMGTGLFVALMPPGIRNDQATKVKGVELDSITGRIAKQLYQADEIRIEPFQETPIPDNSVSLFISNVPFLSGSFYDRHDKDLQHGASLHDFFFEKAIKKTRPGGLVVFITSRFSLDSLSSSSRRRWADLGGNLVGAIRLPASAFRGIADTSVVTDVVVFQKRLPSARVRGPSFSDRGLLEQHGYWGFPEDSRKKTWFDKKTEFPVNEYFVTHPDNIIGSLSWTGTMRTKGGLNVEYEGKDVANELRAKMVELANGVDADALEGIKQETEKQTQRDRAPDDWPDDWMRVEGSRIYINEGGRKKEVPAPYVRHERNPAGQIIQIKANATAATRTRGLLEVFGAAEDLIGMQTDPKASDAELDKQRKKLNKVYDKHVKKYGPLSNRRNRAYAKPSITVLTRLLSLENYDQDTDKAEKTAIFSKRTQYPYKPPESADSPEAALHASLSYKGRIDLPYMAALTGKSEQTIQAALAGKIFRDPETRDWEIADFYLSGDVREKLKHAQGAATLDPGYQQNVDALENVQPQKKRQDEIQARLGNVWIPMNHYEDFAEHISGKGVQLSRTEANNTWVFTYDHHSNTERELVDFGTDDFTSLELMERYLNKRPIQVWRRSLDGTRYVDVEGTALAQSKLEKILNEFESWAWDDQDRAIDLEEAYNDKMNNMRAVQFDGRHLELPGMAVDWRGQLYEHQLSAIWRGIITPRVLLGHSVGLGKTAVMAAIAMERKRLSGDPSYKTMLVVPNHLIKSGQTQKEIRQLYPSAKVLAATPAMLSGVGRRTLLKRLASQNYDIVVVAQSSFTRIPLPPEYETSALRQELAQLEAEAREAHANDNKNYEAEIQAQIHRLQEKLRSLSSKAHRDRNSVYFDELGINALMVDEAHDYKALQVRTRMTRVPGVNTRFSGRAFDLWLKVHYFDQARRPASVVFATGTPITNTLGEVYVLQKYLQPEVLQELGTPSFDSWVANFGDVRAELELDPAGTGLRIHDRLRDYKETGPLMEHFAQVADIRLSEDVAQAVKKPKVAGGRAKKVEIPPNPWIEAYMESLLHRAETIRARHVDPKDDNMLKLMGDGRLAALDVRLVMPDAPDLADSKLNYAVDRVHRIWEATKDKRLTQLVWMDTVSPTGTRRDSRLNLYEEMVDKLVAKGIPRKEIAIVHYYNENRLDALYQDVRKGNVRVLIGSSQKMGTGMNVQNKVIAAHDLDPPFRPDIVEQRLGRSIRPGNTNKEVAVFRYVAKPSMDGYMWQLMESKWKYIQDFLARRYGTSNYSPPPDTLSAAEMKAAASGNPYMARYVEADAALKKLEALRGGWETEQSRVRQRVGMYRARAKQARVMAKLTKDRYREYRERVESYPKNEIRATVGSGKEKAEYTTNKEFGKAVVEKIASEVADMGEALTKRWFHFSYNGLRGSIRIIQSEAVDPAITSRVQYRLERKYKMTLWADAPSGEANEQFKLLQNHVITGDSPAGVVSTITRVTRKYLEHGEERHTEEAEKADLQGKAASGREEQKFPQQEELDNLRQEVAELGAKVRFGHEEIPADQELLQEISKQTTRPIAIRPETHSVYFQDDDEPVPMQMVFQASANITARKRQEAIDNRKREMEEAERYQWTRPADSKIGKKRLQKPAEGQMAASSAGKGYGEIRQYASKPAKVAMSPGKAMESVNPGALQRAAQSVLKIVSPASVSKKSALGSRIIRQALAETAQRRVVLFNEIRKLRRAFWFMGRERILQFYDNWEKGLPQATPKLQRINDIFTRILDELAEEIESFGPGHISRVIENFAPHVWLHPKEAAAAFANMRRPLEGSRAFKKHRYVPLVREGVEEHHLEPVSWNPADQVFFKGTELLKYIEAQRLLRSLNSYGAIRFVYIHSQLPKGWAYVNDHLFTKYGPPELPIKEAYDARLVGQLMEFASSIGVDVQRVMKMRGWGEAKPGEVTTKFAGPEAALIHELGHQLGYQYGLWDYMLHNAEGEWHTISKGPRRGQKEWRPSRQAKDARKTLNEEWRVLADARFEGEDTSKGFRKYVRKKGEKEAVLLQAFLYAPEKMKKLAPHVYKQFESLLKSNIQLRPLLSMERSLVVGESEGAVKVPGMTIIGRFALPEEIAELLNNHLSPGLWGSRYEVISKAYEMWRRTTNDMNMAQLSWSAFHPLFVTLSSTGTRLGQGLRNIFTLSPKRWVKGAWQMATFPLAAPINLWDGVKLRRAFRTTLDQISDPAMRELVQAGITGGLRSEADKFYFNQAVEHLGHSIGTMLRTPNKARRVRSAAAIPKWAVRSVFETSLAWSMKHYIPLMKLGMFTMLAHDEMSHLPKPPDAWADTRLGVALTEAADAVDDRLGMLVYDNLFWNRILKDILLGTQRATGWNLGFLRGYVVGPAIDILRTPQRLMSGDDLISLRMAELAGMVLILHLVGGVIHYLLTGQYPSEEKDYLFPWTGRHRGDGSKERLNIPSYAKEVYSWSTDPIRTMKNKANPLIGALAELATNEDYYGTQVHNPDEPAVSQFSDLAKWGAEKYLAFSVRNWQEMRNDGAKGFGTLVTAGTGIGVAPAYISQTPAQKLMNQYRADQGRGTRTKEQTMRSRLRHQIINRLRTNKTIDELNWQDEFDASDMKRIRREAAQPPFSVSFKYLPLKGAFSVYNIGNDEERDQSADQLFRKFLSQEPGNTEVDRRTWGDMTHLMDLIWPDLEARLSPAAAEYALDAAKIVVLGYEHPRKSSAESDEEYEGRVRDWEARRGSLTSWLKRHRRSPYIAQAIDKLRQSKAYRDLISGRGQPKFHTGDDFTEYRRRWQLWMDKSKAAQAWIGDPE